MGLQRVRGWGRVTRRDQTGVSPKPQKRSQAWLVTFLLLTSAFALLLVVAPAAQAISIRASASTSNGGGATTLTINKPTGTAQYDLLLAQVTFRGGTGVTVTAPAGWTLIRRTDSTTTLGQASYYKVAGAAEGASYTWTFSATQKASGGIMALVGVDNTAPIDASAGQANAASTSVTASSITTTVPNALVVGHFGIASGTTVTPATGMTEQYEAASAGGGAATRNTAEGAYVEQAAAGASGSKTATAGASAVNIGHLIALKPPTVSFSLPTSSGAESSTPASLAVTLSSASSATTTVDYAVTGGTATGSGTDFTLSSGAVTFPAGATTQNIDVTIADDALDELDETLVVSLSNPAMANLGSTTSHTYTISDDDAAPTVTLGLSGNPMAEAAGAATVTATLSGASAFDVTVNLAFSGTATLSTDYTRSGTSIPIAAGATTGTVSLTAVQDTVDEVGETIIVDIDTVTNAAESGAQQVTATITDDDLPTVTVTASDASASEPGGNTGAFTVTRATADDSIPLTVLYATSGTASSGTDYLTLTGSVLIPPGTTSATVAVTPLDDASNEADETVVLTLSTDAAYAIGSPASATVTIADDEPPSVSVTATDAAAAEPGSDTGTFTVSRTGDTGSSLTVNYATSGTAAVGTDYSALSGTVTIAAGSGNASITMTPLDDTLDETDETITFTLSSDPAYAIGSPSSAAVTLADDDSPPIVTLALTGTLLAEASGVTTVTAALSTASGQAVTVGLAFSGTAATQDYSRSGASITIPAGSTTGTVTLTAVQDSIDELDETVVVDIDSVTNGAESGTQQVTATITDDDAPPTITLSLSGSPLAEDAGAATVTATLSSASGQAVMVALAFTGTAAVTSDYTRSATSITISPGATTGSVVLTAVQDPLDEPQESILVDIDSVTNGAEFGTQQVTASITDDDAAPTVTLGLSGSPMAEASESATVTASLSGPSGLDVTVNLAFGGTAAPTSDYTRSATSIPIAAGDTTGTVTLTAVQDTMDEAVETIVVDIDTVSNGAESGTQRVTASITDDDAAVTVTLSLTGSPVAEAGGIATATASLSAASGQDVTVNLAFSGTASTSTDYTPSGTSITINAGSTTGTVTFTAVQDGLDEDDETIIVDIDAVTNAVESGTQQVTSTIADDDAAPTVSLDLSGSPALESGGVATVTATLSAVSGKTVTVNLLLTGTATLTSDYTRSGTTITIPAGSTTGAITVTAVQDVLDEAEETITLDINTVTNGVESGTQQVTATITDDDAAPTVTLSLSGNPMAEASGTATVTATLSAASGQEVTVHLAFSGTATITSDYARSGTSITIPAGSTSGSITLTAAQDALDEASETIVLDIQTVSNGAESGTQQVTANITDDDAAPTVTLSVTGGTLTEASGTATVTAALSAESGRTVTVNLGFSGTADSGDDFAGSATSITILPGGTSGSITVTPLQDALDESDESILVDIATVTNGAESGTQQVALTLADDDAPPTVTLSATGSPFSEAGGSATLTTTLSTLSGKDVGVTFAVGGTATSTSDFTLSPSILIPAGVLAASTTLAAVQDAVDEPTETVIIDIETVTNGVESGTQQVVADLADDDGPTVTVAATDALASEPGANTATFTVSRTTGDTSGSLTVLYAVSGTATNASDYAALSGSVLIPAGQPSAPVTVSPSDDTTVESSETVTLTLASHPAYTLGSPSSANITIADDDVAGITVSPTSGLTTTESGGTATFTVRLNTVPAANVIVGLASNDDTEGSVAPAALTFTPQSGLNPQTVTVTGVDDALADGAVAYRIVTAAAQSSDAEYSGTNPADVNVTNQDDDTAGFTLIQTAGNTLVSESGTTDTFVVLLTARPSSSVLIAVASPRTTEATVTPSSLTFTTSNWNSLQAVTVTGVDDSVVDGTQTTMVLLSIVDASSADDYDDVADQAVAVWTTDNDLAGLTIVQSGGSTIVNEDGSSDAFTVALDRQPASNVSLRISSSDPGEANATPSQISFTPSDWNVAKTVTVTGVDDLLLDGPQMSLIRLSVIDAASSDEYDPVPDQTVVAITTDDDAASRYNFTQRAESIMANIPLPFSIPPGEPTSPMNLTQVIFTAQNATSEAIEFITNVLAGLPSGTPPPPSGVPMGQIWEMELAKNSGGTVGFTKASIRFFVSQSWVDANCPPSSCAVRLFHYKNTTWETLEPTTVSTNSTGITFEANATSFSPFVVGGTSISSGGGGGGGGASVPTTAPARGPNSNRVHDPTPTAAALPILNVDPSLDGARWGADLIIEKPQPSADVQWIATGLAALALVGTIIVIHTGIMDRIAAVFTMASRRASHLVWSRTQALLHVSSLLVDRWGHALRSLHLWQDLHVALHGMEGRLVAWHHHASKPVPLPDFFDVNLRAYYTAGRKTRRRLHDTPSWAPFRSKHHATDYWRLSTMQEHQGTPETRNAEEEPRFARGFQWLDATANAGPSPSPRPQAPNPWRPETPSPGNAAKAGGPDLARGRVDIVRPHGLVNADIKSSTRRLAHHIRREMSHVEVRSFHGAWRTIEDAGGPHAEPRAKRGTRHHPSRTRHWTA